MTGDTHLDSPLYEREAFSAVLLLQAEGRYPAMGEQRARRQGLEEKLAV